MTLIRHKFQPKKEEPKVVKQLLRNCTYLEDSGTVINGIRIWGSPWQPWFCDWAFNVERGELMKYWKLIPTDTDVLMTHGPPIGHGLLRV